MPVQADDITTTETPETPAPAPSKDASKDTGKEGGEIPDAVLEEVPALQLLLNGSPPATFAPKEAQFPELKVLEKHLKDLGKAGFGVYGTKDGSNVVLFNGLYITPEQVKKADEAGQLDSVAVPYEELRGALGAESAQGEPDTAGATVTPPAPSGGAPAATPKSVTTARTKNISIGAPTSGPAPGQGRILNSILKPVV
jgi:hypothetical protein